MKKNLTPEQEQFIASIETKFNEMNNISNDANYSIINAKEIINKCEPEFMRKQIRQECIDKYEELQTKDLIQKAEILNRDLRPLGLMAYYEYDFLCVQSIESKDIFFKQIFIRFDECDGKPTHSYHLRHEDLDTTDIECDFEYVMRKLKSKIEIAYSKLRKSITI